ncbi:DUF2155 domain-containing protein [Oleispirillum naphthae]|uniref:DUF2155 domain-containing protein n=1 Tax=Oleispirillum naphthae TaxID=2838853 RepID=UPI0030824365
MIRLAPAALALGTALFALAPAPIEAATNIDTRLAILRGLDKITGRITTITAVVGDTVRFGSLAIIVRACRTRPPEEAPESAAFLDITELKPSQPPADVFRGWMFASSPAVSAMDHPVYDVWVLECREPLKPRDEPANPIETG